MGDLGQTLLFEGFPGRHLSVWLFEDVKNGSAIKERIVAGDVEPELAFVNAALVAAFKALVAQQRQKLVTRTLHSELVYNIAGSKHITEALKRFGVTEETGSLLVARFDAQPGDLDAACKIVEGTLVDVQQLRDLADIAAVKKYYKILEPELKVGTLSDAILCKVAAVDC